VPVVAAGGIADGRGLAAALTLGAVGVNIGTRFLASEEAAIEDSWKRALVDARSEDAVKVDFTELFPPAGPHGFFTRPRALSTPFIEMWNPKAGNIGERARDLGGEMVEGIRGGRGFDYIPFTGETAGMIGDVRPAAEIVESLVREAEEALRSAGGLAG
jgi:nitronate monooxygenase/enoyl-[acyl-carrier protein] reductase II